jgi:hypothetical protein
MPASLPGATLAQNLANPSQGRAVTFDPISGAKGSPLDRDNSGNASTGALSTGIGLTPSNIIGLTAPASIFAAGYNDNGVPGERITVYAAPPPPGVVTTDIADSTMMYIGGGRMIANVDPVGKFSVPFVPSKYTAGIAIAAAGNGGSRDAGAGPAFTAFAMKMVTATGAVANGAAIEAGFLNRSNIAMVTGQSAFGSDAAALAAPA